jgi:hypothetical protein
MSRFVSPFLIAALLLGTIVPVQAAERDAAPATLSAPSAAVAAAWKAEADARQGFAGRRALYAAYGVLQGLDMYSTVSARRHGAREVNPVMSGGAVQGALMKTLFATGTYAAVHKLSRKNRKAALVTMVALNAVTAAVVANNFRNAR